MDRATSKPLNSRACDACKLRRKRCEYPQTILPNSSSESCIRCSSLKIPCTYKQPSRTRGRKKRSTVLDGSLAQIPTTLSEPWRFRPEAAATTGSADFLQNSPLVYLEHHNQGVPIQGYTACSPNSSNSRHSRRSNFGYPTDNICARELLTVILDDYLYFIYPLVPLIHRPTFIEDLQRGRDVEDADFHSLMVGICAVVVAILPRRFKVYQNYHVPLKFVDRHQMINECHDTILRNRPTTYFDRINHCKWAIAYAFRIAFYHLGEHNRSRMMDIESTQLARLLGFHNISEYEGLNCIQTQLRKKAFWLVFYSYAHNQLQCVRSERPSYIDPDMLSSIRLQDLLPVDVDDEMVLHDRYLPQPSTKPCVTSGFIIHSRVFWAGLRSTQASADAFSDESCRYCLRHKNATIETTHLRERLRELKYMLDDVPSRLRQWVPMHEVRDPDGVSTDESITDTQFAILRSNLHSTHLWLQSLLLDRYDIAQEKGNTGETPYASSQQLNVWIEREELSRQMLHVLHNIPFLYLEPNGLNLTEKIRDMAVSLLSCPFPPEDSSAKRAKEYVREFSEIIARFGVDPVHTSNTQSWVDTDRVNGAQPSLDTPNNQDGSWT